MRDVLVLVPGEVVDSVHVSPINNIWELVIREEFPSIRRSLHFSHWESSFLDTASSGRRFLIVWGIFTRESRLREGIDGSVI